MTDYKKIVILKMGDLTKYSHPDYEELIINGTKLPKKLFAVSNIIAGATPPDPASVKAVIITGSSLMITSDYPWKTNLLEWLSTVIMLKIPVLGICFGHQLLALLLGGKVANNPKGIELGTCHIYLNEAGKNDSLLGNLYPCFLTQESHVQSVLQPPSGAVVLAYNEHDSCQAFRYGANVWGVQFHPEFDLEIMQKITVQKAADVNYKINPEVILAGLRATSESYGLLKKFVDIVGYKH